MLKKIEIEGFKSFKNTTEINLEKTNYTLLPQNISEEGILKGIILVGGNGSGKSSVLAAIRILLIMMFGEADAKLWRYPCMFMEKPAFRIKYTFEVNLKMITYTISYTSANQTIEENLVVDGMNLIERVGKGAITNIDNVKKSHDSSFIKSDGLFLRTLYFNGALQNNKTILKWIEFLKQSRFLDASCLVQEGVGISASDKEYFENHGTDDINEFLRMYNYNQQIEYTSKLHRNNKVSEMPDKTLVYKRNGMKDFHIQSELESHGNRTLISFLSQYLQVLKNGGMLIVDEFSSGFHNELEKLLIRHFMQNSVNSQMIIVSHSTNLLSNTVFRPDQEYSVTFESKSGSKVNRFSNQKPRNSQNIEKMYNSGVFEGKPIYEADDNEA